MRSPCRHAWPIRLQRCLTLLAATLLPALGELALAQELPPAHIAMSKAQIERSGIRTGLVVPADAAATRAQAASADGQRLSGTAVAPPNATAIVSTAMGGIVQQVLISTLQSVERDTPVAMLFSQPLMETQREYLQMAIQARLARDKQARDERLFGEGIISRSRVQESRGAAMQAELAAGERRHALRAAGMSDGAIRKMVERNSLSPQLTILAGARGTVAALDIHAGQRIEAGMPLATISTGVAPWIELQATRQQAAQIRVGDQLQIRDCGPARVTAVAPQVDASNQSTLIRVQLLANAGCVKPNQFVEASYGGAGMAPGSMGVPAAAIVRHGDGAYVFARTAQGFEAVRVGVLSAGADRVWVRPIPGKLVAGTAVAVTGIVTVKGSWLGLGAEASAAEAAPGPTPAGAR